MVCPHGQGGKLIHCIHFVDKGEGVNFLRFFFADILYGRPLFISDVCFYSTKYPTFQAELESESRTAKCLHMPAGYLRH